MRIRKLFIALTATSLSLGLALNGGTSVIGASADDSFKGSAYIFSISTQLYLPVVLKD